MKNFIRIVVVLGFVATTSPAAAEIFKWVDKKGTIHFTEDPSTIPEKYRNQMKVRKTEEDYMTPEERIRAKQEQENRARQNIERNKQEYQRSLQEENRRKGERQLQQASEERKAEQERQVREMKEAIKKEEKRLQEEEDSYKKCYNCDGKGYIGVEVTQTHGGVVIGGSSNIQKTCSICLGSGKIKK